MIKIHRNNIIHNTPHLSYTSRWDAYNKPVKIKSLVEAIPKERIFRARIRATVLTGYNEDILRDKLQPYGDMYNFFKINGLDNDDETSRIFGYQYIGQPDNTTVQVGKNDVIGKLKQMKIKDINIAEIYEARRIA